MRIRWCALVLAGSLVGGAARATSGFTVDANTGGSVVQGIDLDSLHDEFQQDAAADSFPAAASTQRAQGSAGVGLGTAHGQATAAFGLLTAAADASSEEDPNVHPDAQASAVASDEIFDTLHVESGSLGVGAVVHFHVDLEVGEDFSPPAQDPGGHFHAEAVAKLDADSSVGDIHLISDNFDPAGAVTSGDLDAAVGDAVTLVYRVVANTQVFPGGSKQAVQASVSGRPQFTLLAPADVTLAADSGHDYAQLAPEARADESALAAFGALFVARRARRS